MKQSKKSIKAGEFDRKFETEEVSEYLDRKTAKVRHAAQRINIDIPQKILEKVDREAVRIGIPRTSLIKLWIAEHADHLVGSS